MRLTRIGGALLGAGVLLAVGLRVEIRVGPSMLGARPGPPQDHRPTPPPPFVTSGEPTAVTMRNVDFHVAPGVVLRIHWLAGRMHGRGGVVDFDDPSSYVTDVSSAEVGLTGPDFTHLMNDVVFAYRGAPLSNLRIEVGPDGIRQTGTLHNGVRMHFDMTSSVSLTADGRIRLTTRRLRILGVDGLALMRGLGLSLEVWMPDASTLRPARDP